MFASAQCWTLTLTNDSVTLLEEYSIRKLSIKCTTSTGGTILGGAKCPFPNLATNAITITQSNPFTFESENYNLAGTVITAPAGCTLEMCGQST